MILIVGGAGYIGSHVNKELSKKKYDTVVYDNLIYGHEENVKWGVFEQGDLCDSARLDEVFRRYRIDAVMHFSAYAYVGESVINPGKYYDNNVVNTINLLNIMRKYHVDKFIFSSSCATYGIPPVTPIHEELEQRPINPYGRTKLFVEQILKDYEKAYGLKFCCLRYFNAAGADPEAEVGENHIPETHIIPLLLDVAAGKTECFHIFGIDYPTKDGTCIRDYIHVMDLAQAHILAYEYLVKGGVSGCFNLGNGNGYSVNEIVESVRKVTGRAVRTVNEPRREGDPPCLVGDAEKAKKILGWNPQYKDIDQIVKHAWIWYQKLNRD